MAGDTSTEECIKPVNVNKKLKNLVSLTSLNQEESIDLVLAMQKTSELTVINESTPPKLDSKD